MSLVTANCSFGIVAVNMLLPFIVINLSDDQKAFSFTAAFT